MSHFIARPLVVVEYAQFGDLLGYLRKSRGMRDNYYSDPSVKPVSSLTSHQLLKFAWEISDGMQYLSMKKVTFTGEGKRNDSALALRRTLFLINSVNKTNSFSHTPTDGSPHFLWTVTTDFFSTLMEVYWVFCSYRCFY